MADQLLSVQDTSIQAVANAIKSKTGNSNALQFPGDFVDAINGIDTYANATDKVSPQTVTLTPSSPTYSIQPGMHDGNDIVQIVTEDQTVTPSTSDVVVTAPTGKFLGAVTVNAASMGDLHMVKTGTVTVNNVGSFRVRNLGFKPSKCIMFLQSYNSDSSLYKVASARSYNESLKTGDCGTKNNDSFSRKTSSSPGMFEFKDDYSMVVSNTYIQSPSRKTPVFAGTYYYVVWG